ncbi:HD domain-containing protein [Thiospirochaeta perfilievii]|uniref:bis(5'-nucleosyl)-tetraphosphatase (symmetrical) n=1 Tax=Thiospirochaeta perfilievii TaxID=252967 RepID=A0A5C1QFR3_9SPIO|nr:bis(5'-nucleosyl)-tetraphosphatase (symmetrical) YqeK [Thiospirochaeta perfilievii]QEN06208.1 HD domain-containing protein [Thiospirochaeta perfilievii]
MDYTEVIVKIDNYLKKNISEGRYLHSIKVAEMSSLIAKLTRNDMDIAYISGLAHDIAREFKVRDLKEQISKFNIFSEEFLKMPQLYHGPVGAAFVKEEFSIINSDILEAIMFHTVGFPNMCNNAKIIYVADYISLDRTHIDKGLREAILNKSLDKMVLDVINLSKDFLISKGNSLVKETEDMYKSLMEINFEKK